MLERELAAEKFDYVMLSMHNECWTTSKPKELIAAVAEWHEIITKHGAQSMLYMLFKGPKSPEAQKLVPFYESAFRTMSNREIGGRKREVILVPGTLDLRRPDDRLPADCCGISPPRTPIRWMKCVRDCNR